MKEGAQALFFFGIVPVREKGGSMYQAKLVSAVGRTANGGVDANFLECQHPTT